VNDKPGGRDARPKHWLVDAIVGGGLALGLITAANASLPRLTPTAPEAPPAPRAAPAPVPAPPPVLIAFRTPAPGYPIISPFGLRKLPWEEAGRLHAGVDIAAPAGSPVLAAADGVVTRMDVDPGYGRFVEVRHAAGLSTRYGHLSRYAPQLHPGVAVKAGQPLGAMGSTGTSTGSHVHFEIRDAEGRPLNPELFLGRSFATRADLPLKAARRLPRGVRIAYVSNIPRAKRQEMRERLQLADAAESPRAETARAEAGEQAASADGAAVDAAARVGKALAQHGRPHARFRPRSDG
jgi:hypothetical protein